MTNCMPTTTAEKLAKMTDRAAFERLALAVIGLGQPRYAFLIQAGTNAAGESVAAPIDGFRRVPGNTPSEFVLAEATTTDEEGLQAKWLFDHQAPPSGRGRPRAKPPTAADDGDLLKAARSAAPLRVAEPTATFTVVLASNQRVDQTLFTEVQTIATKLGVQVDIWEQSNIATLLDTNPTGQYLRQQYLGTPAERLSLALLKDVGRQHLDALAANAHHAASSQFWIQRRVDDELYAALLAHPNAFHLLIGESGFGKTVASSRVMARWISDGGCALWLDAFIAERANSLYDAIEITLRDRIPTLAEAPIRVLADLLKSSLLLLVIDDINRTRQPKLLLRRIAGWLMAEAPKKEGQRSPFLALCSVWPRHCDLLEMQGIKHIKVTNVGSFTEEEAERALGQVPGASRVVQDLAGDPLAIGLYRELSTRSVVIASDGSASLLEQFVSQRLGSVREMPGVSCLSSEHYDALVAMSVGCIDSLHLAPKVIEVRDWFRQPREFEAFAEVLRHSALVWEDPVTHTVQYRHDRIRDHILAMGMKRVIQRGTNREPFFDPYFAEISAKAYLDLGSTPEMTSECREKNALILACALSRCRSGSTAETTVTNALWEWLAQEESESIGEPKKFEFTGSKPHESVVLSGTFNGWTSSAATRRWCLRADATRTVWRQSFLLDPGRYLYKFEIDGSEWQHDVTNPATEPDGYGGLNSVLIVQPQEIRRPAHASIGGRLILRQLAETDCKSILTLTKGLSGDPYVLLARARNGDLSSAIEYCQSLMASPLVVFSEGDAILDAACQVHACRWIPKLLALALRLTADVHLFSACLLIGYLGDPALVGAVEACWRSASNRTALLPAALWAALSSEAAINSPALLGDMFDFYETLPDGDTEAGRSRAEVADYLSNGNPHLSAETIAWLVQNDINRPSLRNLLWATLDGIDDPGAVEAIARWAGELLERGHAEGTAYVGVSTLTDKWRREGRLLGPASKERLSQIFSSDAERPSVRTCAFRIWAASAGMDELDELRINSTRDPLAKAAVWRRAWLGDQSASVLVAEKFRKDSH